MVISHFGLSENKIAGGDPAKQRRLNRQISHGGTISAETLSLVLLSCPDVSAEWLLRGEGEMLRTAPATASLSIGGNNNGTASVSARGNTTTHTTNNYGGCPETIANEKLGQQALTDLHAKMAVLEERTKSLTSLLEEKDKIIKLFERLTDK